MFQDQTLTISYSTQQPQFALLNFGLNIQFIDP